MNRLFWLAMVLLCSLDLACHHADACATDKNDAALGEYKTIYEVGVRIRVPAGFEELGKPGFQHSENGCLIMAYRMQVAFTEDFEKHAKSLQEGKVLERTQVQVDGKRGVLIHLEKPQDVKNPDRSQTSWNLVFGDDKTSWMVFGVYFKDSPQEYRDLLKAVVLSAQIDNSPPPKPGDRQSFTLTPSNDLKVVEAVWKDYIFTQDGEIPTKSVSAPIVIAGNHPLKPNPKGDKRAFAETSLKREPGVTKFDIYSVNQITLDGIDGYELTADGVHIKGKKPVKLYYVVLFDTNEYVIFSGYCGSDVSEKYLREFKAMAASFQRKKK